MNIINPATEEVITTIPEDTLTTLEKKFSLLKQGQPLWHQKSLQERITILRNFKELLSENIESLCAILTSEVGKPLQQSRNEVNGAIARIEWLTNNGEKYLVDEWMTQEDSLGEKISYESLGIVCNISAWNYPYLVGVNAFVPALMAGNSVMYKPSEYATLTGLEIERLLKRAGIPDNAFHIAIGTGNVGELLLAMPFNGFFFTGSNATGKHIYSTIAPKMVTCQLELGGKDPLYVADDVEDLKSVIAGTADGAFYNNGQSCCSVERIYVHEKLYDLYVVEFVKEVSGFKLGLPTEEGIYIGPLTRKNQLQVLDEQVADAKAKGAKVLLGGKRMNRKGYYFEPTVLADVTNEMKIMRDESFGPIIGIMKVKDDQEAISLMADTDFGLTASVYCKSLERAQKILSQLETGSAYWNCCDRVSAPLPWSGRKNSGIGSTLSHAGIRAFTHPKAYHLRGKI
ncbi:MAG: aldehyde dehydrogenase family protein [Bacteroidia bacterium]|nr:aldehyde dehydrogenase family protein [Bacteroidia bacterium]